MLNLKMVLLTEWRSIALLATNRTKDDAHISATTAAQRWTCLTSVSKTESVSDFSDKSECLFTKSFQTERFLSFQFSLFGEVSDPFSIFTINPLYRASYKRVYTNFQK